jgi:predicted RecB family nuclease
MTHTCASQRKAGATRGRSVRSINDHFLEKLHMKPASSTPAHVIEHAAGRARSLGREWVTKTDMVRFIRCPYAFVQVDSGLLAPEELLDPVSVQLIDEGTEFHVDVLATAEPLPAGVRLEDMLTSEETLLGLPTLRNKRLKLLGEPNGIRTASGALIPIEIKSHKNVRRIDLLELPFYWLVLEPYRTRHDVDPCGELILRRGGLPERVAVQLDRSHFDEVTDIVKQIRRARRHGVKPRVCGCAACRGPLSEKVRWLTAEGKDLTMIWDIGRKRADALEALGIDDYEALIECDPVPLVEALRAYRSFVSAEQVKRWRRHAEAYQQAQAVIFGPPAPVDDTFIALDMEYDPDNPHIWLIGVLACDRDHQEHISLWAENHHQEKKNLLALGELARSRPAVPIISWGGVMADIPQLQNAVERLKLGNALAPVFARHIDLFMHSSQTLRIPRPRFLTRRRGRLLRGGEKHNDDQRRVRGTDGVLPLPALNKPRAAAADPPGTDRLQLRRPPAARRRPPGHPRVARRVARPRSPLREAAMADTPRVHARATDLWIERARPNAKGDVERPRRRECPRGPG